MARRHRRGQDWIPLVVDHSHIQTLIELQWLSEAEAADKRMVGAVIIAVLEDLTEYLRLK